MAYAIFIGWAFLLTAISWIRPRDSGICGVILLLSAIAFTGLRGISDDYLGYVNMFHAMATSSLALLPRLYIGKDPLFGGLILAAQWIGLGTQGIFLTAAALALIAKARAFVRVFGSYVTPLFVTICSTYFLHEYTQIRVAIALGFAFLGLVALARDQKALWAVFSILAVGFHISALAVVLSELPFLLKIDRTKWLVAYGLAGLTVTALAANLLKFISDITSRASSYKYAGHVSSHGLLVACFNITVITVLAYLVLADEQDPNKRRIWKACYFMQVLGFGVFLIFVHRAAGLGFRIMEIFGAFSVFIVSEALLTKHKLAWGIAFAYCMALLMVLGASHLLPVYRLSSRPFW